jgi:hypothetical protein
MKPVALFIPEQTKHGRIFHPANQIAQHFAALAGVEFFPETRLRHIVALGFEVAETNGQPIPITHPWKGYRKRTEQEPRHFKGEV